METRPKIKIRLTSFDKTLEWISHTLTIIMWLVTIFSLLKLPEIIPIHYNSSGQPDNYGSKLTLLFLPVLGTILYIVFTILTKLPHIFNYMVPITEDNAERQYSNATRMLRLVKLSILVIFNMIILFTYFITTGITKGIGFWFLPLIFILLLTPTVIGIVKSFKDK